MLNTQNWNYWVTGNYNDLRLNRLIFETLI